MPFLYLTGPSDQIEIGPDRVEFKSNITFTAGGSKEQTVSALIINDQIAFEDDEVVPVGLTIISPSTGVNLGAFPTTVVTIVDNDRKSATAIQSCRECFTIGISCWSSSDSCIRPPN